MNRDFKIKKSNPKFGDILHKFQTQKLLKHAKGLQIINFNLILE
jgi:hypothetical protein